MKVGQTGNHPVKNTNDVKEAKETKDVKKADRPERSERTERTETLSNGDAKAEISAKSKEFAQAKAVATHAPDVREDKVADLKKRIAEGNYQVDHDSLAERMVDDHIRSGIG